MQLYVLAHQYAELLDLVDKECDNEVLKDTLEGLQGELEEKVDNIVKLMRSIQADETALKAEEERLANRRIALQLRRESIKDYLEAQLLSNKIDKVKTALATTWIQNNKPSVVIADENAPELKAMKEVWVSHPDTLDKTKIYELIKAGQEVPGATLNTTRSIRIR